MKTGFFFAFLLTMAQVSADTDIHTINLKHRLATDVIPQIEPFLPETATIRAYGDMLILKSDRATLANVEQLLSKLDVAQQSVMVTVMRSTETIHREQGGSTQVQINSGDDVNASVGINRWSTRNNNDDNQRYQARGITGQPISISLGEDIPQHQHLIFIDPYGGVSLTEDNRYIATENGFRAVPFLLPDNQVRVEIHPFFSKLSADSDAIRSSNILTTVVGSIGEWLEIGGITENAQQHNDGVTTYSSRGSLQQTIYLKVEPSSK
ncbi:hypothetical protein [Methylophaga sp.]|uniref:hypothetical protein n=1 Tax=Methylophaga sp. TaxID=2024840 RepID=UPI003F69DD6B